MLGVGQKAEPVETPERTEITRDELMGMMINHAFSTGECVFANIGDDGAVKFDTNGRWRLTSIQSGRTKRRAVISSACRKNIGDIEKWDGT